MLFRAKETFRKEMRFVLSGQQFSPSSLVKFLGALAHAGGGAAEAPGAAELKRCPAYLEPDRPGRVLAPVPTLGTPTPRGFRFPPESPHPGRRVWDSAFAARLLLRIAWNWWVHFNAYLSIWDDLVLAGRKRNPSWAFRFEKRYIVSI